MDFEKLVYEVSELFHEEVIKSKEELFTKPEFQSITMSQWSYLENIYKLGEPTYSELAEKLGFSKASVSTSISKLISMGYVCKAQSNEDQRAYNIYLSEKGREAVLEHIEGHMVFARKLIGCLNEKQVENAVDICSTILKSLRK